MSRSIFSARGCVARSAGRAFSASVIASCTAARTTPRPRVVTPALLDELRELTSLAPLHQPYNLAAIDAFAERMPDVPQVACFDTAFHRGQPAVAQLVPLPADIRAAACSATAFTAFRTNTSRRYCRPWRRTSP